MSMTMDDLIKRWTAKRKTALVIEIIQGKTMVAEAGQSFELAPPRSRDASSTRGTDIGGGRARGRAAQAT